MSFDIDSGAAKKSTSLSINSDLLAQGKALKINLSATLEARLTELINAKQRKLWKEENKTTIESYNQLTEEHGLFSDDLRCF